MTVYDVTDISYVVTNEGEQTAALKAFANAPNDGKHVFLMLINRAVPTPAYSYDENGLCKAVDNWQAVPLSTFVTPLAPNPLAPNPLAPNPLAPNPLAPNPLAPNYPPDVSNATFYVAPTSPEQTTARLARPGRGSERLARRNGDARIRSVGLAQSGPPDPYIAFRPRDVTVVTIRDILIDPTGTALTKTDVDFKVKAEIPNHDGENFAAAAAETGTQVPHHLFFTAQPTSTSAGATMAPVTVEIQDTFGNRVTNSMLPVTLILGNNPGQSTLSGTVTRNAVGGVAVFTGLSINNPGVGYTLIASVPTLPSLSSMPFNIVAGANRLAFVVQPTPTPAGLTIAPPIQVAVQDASGNPTTSTASVHLLDLEQPGEWIPGGTTTTSAVNGIATFSNLTISQPGTGYTLRAQAEGGVTAATSQPFDITVPPPSALFSELNTDFVSAGLGG